MADERLVLADNPPETVIAQMAAHLAGLQAKARSGLLTPDDCTLYLRSLERAREWIRKQPPEYQLTDDNLQLLFSEQSQASTKTLLRLRYQDGQLYIVMTRGSGFSSRTCRIEVGMEHTFRKMKRKPEGVASRGGSFFLDWVFTDPTPAEPAPPIPIGADEGEPDELELSAAEQTAQETLAGLEPPTDDVAGLIYEPGETVIRFVSTNGTETCFVSVSPPDELEQRDITIMGLRTQKEYTTTWHPDVGIATSYIPSNFMPPHRVKELVPAIVAHVEKPTTIWWECQKCGEKSPEQSDHHLRMIGKMCSEMGPLVHHAIDVPLITKDEAKKLRARKLRGDALTWAAAVAKLRATADVLKNISYRPNTIHRLMALYLAEQQKKRPRNEVLQAIRKRLLELRQTAPLLLRLQSMTAAEVADREPALLLQAFGAEDLDAALEQLGWEVSSRVILSLVDPPVLERWLTIARDERDGFAHPSPPDVAAAVAEQVNQRIKTGAEVVYVDAGFMAKLEKAMKRQETARDKRDGRQYQEKNDAATATKPQREISHPGEMVQEMPNRDAESITEAVPDRHREISQLPPYEGVTAPAVRCRCGSWVQLVFTPDQVWDGKKWAAHKTPKRIVYPVHPTPAGQPCELSETLARLRCPFEGCGFEITDHAHFSEAMPHHTHPDGGPCAGAICSIAFAFQATDYAKGELERIEQHRSDHEIQPSMSTAHQVAELLAKHAVDELLSGKPSGVDPETAPYILILTARRDDDAWNAPDILGVFRDLGHGPDVIGELKRSVDCREVQVISSAEPIPDYVQEVAVYVEKRGEHHHVPFVPLESRELAYQLAAGGAEIDTCTDMWALRLYILKMAHPERRQQAFKRLIHLYETDPKPPLRFSAYLPTQADEQLCIAHFGPMGRPFSFAEPPKKDEYTGRFLTNSFGPVWGFPELPKPPRPPGQHKNLDDKLEDLETVRKWIDAIDHYEDLMVHAIERELEDRNRPAVLELLRAKLLELKRAPLLGHSVSSRTFVPDGDGQRRAWQYHYAAAPNGDAAQHMIEATLGQKLVNGNANPFWCTPEEHAVELLTKAGVTRFDHRGVPLVDEGEPATCQVCITSAPTFTEQRHDLTVRIIGPHKDQSDAWCNGEGQVVGADLDEQLMKRVGDTIHSLVGTIERCGIERDRGFAAHHLLELTLPQPAPAQPEEEPVVDAVQEEAPAAPGNVLERLKLQLQQKDIAQVTCPWCRKPDAHVRRAMHGQLDESGAGVFTSHFQGSEPCAMEGVSYSEALEIVVDVLERGRIRKPFERYTCPLKGCGKFIKLQVLHGQAVLSPHQDAGRHRCRGGNDSPAAAWAMRLQDDAEAEALQERRELEPAAWVARARELSGSDVKAFELLVDDGHLLPLEWFIDRARLLVPTFKDPHDICPCCRGRYWRNPANARAGKIVFHTKPRMASPCEGQGYSFEVAAEMALGKRKPVTLGVLRKGTRLVPGTIVQVTDSSFRVSWEPDPGVTLEHTFDRETGKARGCSINTLEIHWWTLELDMTTDRGDGRGGTVYDPLPWTDELAATVPPRRFVTLRYHYHDRTTRGEIIDETVVGGSPVWDIQWDEDGRPMRHLFNKSYGKMRGNEHGPLTVDFDHQKNPIPWQEPAALELEPAPAPALEVAAPELEPEPPALREQVLMEACGGRTDLFWRLLPLCTPDWLEPHHRKLFVGLDDEACSVELARKALALEPLMEAARGGQGIVFLSPIFAAHLDELFEELERRMTAPEPTPVPEPDPALEHTCALCKKQIPRYIDGGGPARFIVHRVEGAGWYYSGHQPGWTRCLGTMRTAEETRELAADTRPWIGWRVLYRYEAQDGEPHGHWISAPDERWAIAFHQDRYRGARRVVVGAVPQEAWVFALDQTLRCGTSPKRWQAIRDQYPEGIDDLALLEQIREDWGPKRINKSGGFRGWVGWAKIGGKCPTFEALTSENGEDEPIRVLRGHELVQVVRDILQIPNPNPLARVPEQKAPKARKKDTSFTWGESWVKGAEIEREIYDLYALPVYPDPHGNDCFACPVCQHRIEARYQSYAIKLFRHTVDGKMFPKQGDGEECRGSDQSLALAHLIARGEYPPTLHLPDPPEVARTLEDGTVVLSEQCLICDYPVEVLRDLKGWPELYCSEKYSESDDHGEGCSAAGRDVWHVFNEKIRSLRDPLGGIHERGNGAESWNHYHGMLATWRGQTEEVRAELERRREEERKRRFPEPDVEDVDDEDLEDGGPGEDVGVDERDAADPGSVLEPADEQASAAPDEALPVSLLGTAPEEVQQSNQVAPIHEHHPLPDPTSAQPVPASSMNQQAATKRKGKGRAKDDNPNQLSLFKF